MTEHEKLKEICELIDYNLEKQELYFDDYHIRPSYDYSLWEIDVRQVIFTPEFMDKYDYYRYNNDLYPIEANEILDHLDDPVSYLYNTLWLWAKR